MKLSLNAPCPCHSGKKYKKCCKIYHDKKAFAKDAALLMRSRYSAFALQRADYIIQTTHSSNPDFITDTDAWRKSIENFCKQTLFENLQIIDSLQNGTTATVHFFAKLSVAASDASFSEISEFVKEDGRWYYVSGTIT